MVRDSPSLSVTRSFTFAERMSLHVGFHASTDSYPRSPASDTESVSKLLRVLGVGEENPADMLANQKIAEILANEPDTSLAVCTIGPGPVTPDDLHIFHRKPVESRRRLSSGTATKIDSATNKKKKGVLKTTANAGKKSDRAKSRAASKTAAATKTAGAVKSKVGTSKSATGLTKSTLVITKTQIGLYKSTVASPQVDLGKSTFGVAKSQGNAVKSMFGVTKGEAGSTKSTGGSVKPKAGAKSTIAASKQQVGVAKATVALARAKAGKAKSTGGLAKPSAGMTDSTVTVANRHVRVVRPGSGVAKSTIRVANSTAGVTGSTVGVAKATVGSRKVVGAAKQPNAGAKPNAVLPEKTVPVPKQKLDTDTNGSPVVADAPDSIDDFLDRWVFSVTFPIFILILVFYMLLVYKRIRLCSLIGEFILQLLD